MVDAAGDRAEFMVPELIGQLCRSFAERLPPESIFDTSNVALEASPAPAPTAASRSRAAATSSNTLRAQTADRSGTSRPPGGATYRLDWPHVCAYCGEPATGDRWAWAPGGEDAAELVSAQRVDICEAHAMVDAAILYPALMERRLRRERVTSPRGFGEDPPNVYLRNNGPAILAEMKALRSPDVRPVLSAAARNLRLAHDNGNCEPPCEHCGEEAASTAGDRMQTPDGDVAFLRAPVAAGDAPDPRKPLPPLVRVLDKVPVEAHVSARQVSAYLRTVFVGWLEKDSGFKDEPPCRREFIEVGGERLCLAPLLDSGDWTSDFVVRVAEVCNMLVTGGFVQQPSDALRAMARMTEGDIAREEYLHVLRHVHGGRAAGTLSGEEECIMIGRLKELGLLLTETDQRAVTGLAAKLGLLAWPGAT